MKMVLFPLLLMASFLQAEEPSFQVIEDKTTLPILNPALSERKIAKIRLNNGLEAYLISDPNTDQSAAAMAVEVGSWSDPKEYPGTAHFCEHMLFMGNKAYPTQSEYFQFVFDHGGSANAFTAPDRTVYLFSINNNAFKEALDRFSHFFIDPLFLSSSIEKELHAVDQEHAKNIENDGWREYMILKETGNPLHPNALFSTGNAQTLSGIPRDTLAKWYETYYTAPKMRLILVSSLPLAELESEAVEKFSAVPSRPVKDVSYPKELLSKAQEGHILYIEPVQDQKNITFLWQPEARFQLDLDRKPLDVVSYVLGSDTENSLSALLKRENLAETVRVGSEPLSRDEGFFQISIDLTEEGLKKIPLVSKRVFEAICRLKQDGIPAYLFEEYKKISLLNYQYQSRQDAFSFVQSAGYSIVNEDLSTYPEKTAVPSIYDPACLQAFIDTLTPEKCLFIVQADPQLTGIKPKEHEKWMNAAYTLQTIPAREMDLLVNASVIPQITLPPPNPYIPGHIALVPVPENAPAKPELLFQDELATLYFAQDQTYHLPRIVTLFNFKTPLIDGLPKSQALGELYLYALNDKLTAPLSAASAAGLSFNSTIQDLKVEFSIAGYSETTPLFLKNLFGSLRDLLPSKAQFEIYKQSLLISYSNASKELPVKQAMDALSSVIYNDSPLPQAKYAALQEVSYEEFLKFSHALLQKCAIEGTLYGNLSKENAQALWGALKSSLKATAYPAKEQYKKKVLLLPEAKGPYQITEAVTAQGSGALLMLQQGSFSFEARGAQQILSSALKASFFDTLRTKQQTAYIAKSWDVDAENQLFQIFAVQSSTNPTDDLLLRFELFLEEFNQNFENNISEERFETIRSNQIRTLLMPPENQDLMALRIHTLAFQYRADFDRIPKRVEGLKKITYASLKEYANKALSKENKRRLAVLSQGPMPGAGFQYQEISPGALEGLGQFVTSASD